MGAATSVRSPVSVFWNSECSFPCQLRDHVCFGFRSRTVASAGALCRKTWVCFGFYKVRVELADLHVPFFPTMLSFYVF